jgi:hypothetical protein
MRPRAATTIKLQAVHPGATGGPQAAAVLAELAYELLDAHADTAQLADGLSCDPSWAAHLDYLRALQRAGRELLARTAAPERWARPLADSTSLDVR